MRRWPVLFVLLAFSPPAFALCLAATGVTTCDTTPPRSSGVYYFCNCGTGSASGCQNGSDTNAGTSASAPKQTMSAIQSRLSSLSSGQTIALCRGGAWTSAVGEVPAKTCGTSESTYCDFRDYVPPWGSQATPKPLIATNGTAFAFWSAVTGMRLWNVTVQASNYSDDGQIQIYDAVNSCDFCNVTVSGGKVGFNIQPTTSTSNILRQSTITLIGQTGIYHAASNWTFDSNLFLNNEQATSAQCGGGYCGNYYNHDHYISGTASDVVVKNSEYYTTADHCTDPERCNGVVIYWTDFQTNPIFENNYVHGPGGSDRWGLSSSNNAANTSNYNGIIRRNRWDLPSAHCAVEISACTGCQFLDNIVKVAGTNYGLCTPDQTGQSSPVNSGTIARNNSFYLTGAGVAIHQNSEGTGYVFENNAAAGPSGATCFAITQPLATGHPFTVTNYPSTAANTAGNYCVANGAAPSVIFTDAPNGNFVPGAGSPLIGAGNASYYSATAIGTVSWSASDPGVARAPPIDIGAMVH